MQTNPHGSAGHRVLKIKTSTKVALVQHLEWGNKAQRLRSILLNFSTCSVRIHEEKPKKTPPTKQNPKSKTTQKWLWQSWIWPKLVCWTSWLKIWCLLTSAPGVNSSQALQITPSHSQQQRTPRHFSVHSLFTQTWLGINGDNCEFLITILSWQLTSKKLSFYNPISHIWWWSIISISAFHRSLWEQKPSLFTYLKVK